MSNGEIIDFYSELKRDISNAITDKALRILESRSLRFLREITSNPMIRVNIRRQAMRLHSKAVKSINRRKSRINR